VSGRPLNIVSAPRRLGDPPALVADSSRLQTEMEWIPKYADLTAMIESAIGWEKILIQGRDGKQSCE
jgi:UDP-glucose 4-epimerase